jgi:hypothetical protein
VYKGKARRMLAVTRPGRRLQGTLDIARERGTEIQPVARIVLLMSSMFRLSLQSSGYVMVVSG